MKVIVCLCGLLRFEDQPCAICEADDLGPEAVEAFVDFLIEGLEQRAGDADDTTRQQIVSRDVTAGRIH